MNEELFFASLAGDLRCFLIQGENAYTFDQLYRDVTLELKALQDRSGGHRSCVLIEAENSYETYVKFLVAMRAGWPALLCPSYQFRDESFRRMLRRETGTFFQPCPIGRPLGPASGDSATHPMLAGHPESLFIVRTSGSSGNPYKFIVHRLAAFVSFHQKNAPHFRRTFAFSPADSIAGVETLTEVLVHRATLIAPTEKLSPDSVAETLRRHEVDYFQTTPTFLNLLLLSRQADATQLPHLRKIAFGSEPPLRASLQLLAERLSGTELRQTYGMSEIGILQTHAASEPSLVAFDQNRNPVRLGRENTLEVRSEKQMLGYLNHTASLTNDGWFITGDRAEMDARDCYRVLGRKDDTINVAGRKFFPTELENLLRQMENVADATVRAEKNDLLGVAILAELRLLAPEDESHFRARLRTFLERQVPFFMHPHRSTVVNCAEASERFKKVRVVKAE